MGDLETPRFVERCGSSSRLPVTAEHKDPAPTQGNPFENLLPSAWETVLLGTEETPIAPCTMYDMLQEAEVSTMPSSEAKLTHDSFTSRHCTNRGSKLVLRKISLAQLLALSGPFIVRYYIDVVKANGWSIINYCKASN